MPAPMPPNPYQKYRLFMVSARPDPIQPSANHDRANAQHEARADAIDQVSFERHEPGLQGNEQSESPLDRYQRDVQMSLNRLGE